MDYKLTSILLVAFVAVASGEWLMLKPCSPWNLGYDIVYNNGNCILRPSDRGPVYIKTTCNSTIALVYECYDVKCTNCELLNVWTLDECQQCSENLPDLAQYAQGKDGYFIKNSYYQKCSNSTEDIIFGGVRSINVCYGGWIFTYSDGVLFANKMQNLDCTGQVVDVNKVQVNQCRMSLDIATNYTYYDNPNTVVNIQE